MRPLIQNFKANTYVKAFILNAISSSIIASVAITVKDRLDQYTKYDIDLKIILTFIITFFITLISFSKFNEKSQEFICIYNSSIF